MSANREIRFLLHLDFFMLRIQLTFLLLLFSLYAWSQPFAEPFPKTYSDMDGLPSQEVYDIFQDKKGYIWIASADGLCQYNGREFKRYDAPGQSSISMTGISEDIHGRMWCHNFTGQIFYMSAGRLHIPLGWDTCINTGFANLVAHPNGILWVGSDKGLYKLDFSSGVWTKSKEQISNIRGLILDRSNVLWAFSQDSGIYTSVDGYVWHKEKMKSGNLKIGLTLAMTSKETFIINRDAHEIYHKVNDRYELNKEYSKKISSLPQITGISNLPDGTFAITTYGGIYIFDAEMNLVYGRPLFSQYAISKAMIDREGNWWVSTLGSGILFFPSMHIRTLLPSENIGFRVMKLCNGPESNIVGALQNGLVYLVDAETGKVTHHFTMPNKKNVAAVYFEKSTGKLLVGEDKLYEVDVSNRAILEIEQSGCIKHIESGPGKSIIITTCFGSVIVSRPSLDIEILNKWNFKSHNDIERVLRTSIRGRYVLFDSINQNIYSTYQDGLFVRHYNQETELLNKEGKKIYALTLAISNDTLWVGSMNEGLFAFHRNTEILHLNTEKGLVDNTVTSLKVENENIWIGTYQGLQHFNLNSGQYRIWDRKDGLPSNEINDLALSGNYVWLATGRGMVQMPKNMPDRNLTPPITYIKSVQVNDLDLDLLNAHKLSYKENNIVIELDGLSFRSLEALKYQYRIIGLDSTWTTTPGSNHLVRLYSLPAGTYKFEVKAVNEDQVSSEEVRTIEFTILPPFWETWWIRGVFISSIILGITLIFRNRVQRIRNENALEMERANLKFEKEQIEQQLRISRLAAIKAQMNPHFIFNALNSIQNFFMKGDKFKANEFLGKFSDLIRKILEMSNEETVSLEEEIHALSLYLELEKLRYRESLEYIIENKNIQNPEEIRLPSMLVQPYVENALKHGLLHKKTDRKLLICFEKVDKILKVRVDDNGIGRLQAEKINRERKQYKSFSTKANQKRLELLNFELKNSVSVQIIDKIGGESKSLGTTVILEINITETV